MSCDVLSAKFSQIFPFLFCLLNTSYWNHVIYFYQKCVDAFSSYLVLGFFFVFHERCLGIVLISLRHIIWGRPSKCLKCLIIAFLGLIIPLKK